MANGKPNGRLPEADFRRLKRAMEETSVKAIEKHVPVIVRKEFESIGILSADAESRVEVVKDMLFVRKIRQGADAAEGIVGRRVVNGLLWFLGVLLILGGGALLHRTFGH